MGATVSVTIVIDDVTYAGDVPPALPALTAIRDVLGHDRPRKGCQMGLCGKCESDVDGREVRLCVTPIVELDGATISTPVRRSMFAVT